MTEYRKIINVLDNAQNEPSKFGTITWFEIDDTHVGRIRPITKLN